MEKLRLYLKFSKEEAYAFLSAIITGLFAHAFIFFNNITVHDNTYNFYMGGTYELGRWMLAKLMRVTDLLSGTNYLHYSCPWYIGAMSLVWIGITAALIVRLLEITQRGCAVILGGVLASFPVITSTFGYMFTAGMYTFGTMMGVIGVYLVCRAEEISLNQLGRKKMFKVGVPFLGVCLEACCIGVYQANIGVMTSLTLLYIIRKLEKEDKEKPTEILKLLSYHIVTTVAYMVIYFAALNFFLKRVGATLSSYQGIGESVGFLEYLSRIPVAYKEFFAPTANVSRNMYPGGIGVYYKILLLLIGVGLIFKLYKFLKKGIFSVVVYGLILLVFPLSVNIIYVMCVNDVYSMMMYGQTCIFALMCCMLSENIIKGVFSKLYGLSALLVMFCMVFLYCRLANICYLKEDYIEKAAVSYFTRLVERIEETEGYSPDMSVAYVGYFPVPDNNMFLYPEFSDVYLTPYDFDTITNNYNWKEFMKATCGFNPAIIDSAPYEEDSLVQEMPIYPKPGSIKVIGDTVVVKLGE